MKKILLLAFIICQLKAVAQDIIYLNDGTMLPGKIAEITDDQIKLKNLANPTAQLYTKSRSAVKVAFNSAGDYLVFDAGKPFAEKEKQEFISSVVRPRRYDVVVDVAGNVRPINIADDNDQEIFGYENGKEVKLIKKELVFAIHKDGTHQLFSSPGAALSYLSIDKEKINTLLFPARTTLQLTVTAPVTAPPPNPVVADKKAPATVTPPVTTAAIKPVVIDKKPPAQVAPPVIAPAPVAKIADTKAPEVVNPPVANTVTKAAEPDKPSPLTHEDAGIPAPNMVVFGAKAIEKTKEFTSRLVDITSVKTNRDAAVKSIDLACDLFINQGTDARVEVSNINQPNVKPKKYKVRDYLGRLMIKSGQYDKVQVEYANINYATKFQKGPDGDWYGTVTFVQKFQGFIDGNIAYADQTKRSMTIHLKHYEKAINGETVSGWDLYLEDIGVVETKKI
ncbi:MAG TPA: hypothetical protein VK668_22810 [Mucilaginibacter sp.]|nr:hypothetical protein [Mucilaginibacter sp.]